MQLTPSVTAFLIGGAVVWGLSNVKSSINELADLIRGLRFDLERFHNETSNALSGIADDTEIISKPVRDEIHEKKEFYRETGGGY